MSMTRRVLRTRCATTCSAAGWSSRTRSVSSSGRLGTTDIPRARRTRDDKLVLQGAAASAVNGEFLGASLLDIWYGMKDPDFSTSLRPMVLRKLLPYQNADMLNTSRRDVSGGGRRKGPTSRNELSAHTACFTAVAHATAVCECVCAAITSEVRLDR